MPVDAPPALAWSYSTSANRYRSPNGQFIGAEAIRNLRNDFLDARAAASRQLAADLASDKLSLDQWEQAMRDHIQVTHGVEYVFGRGGLDQMQPKDWDTLGKLVADQWKFLNGFSQGISTGTLSEADIGARAELYNGAATQAYEQGAVSASGAPDLDQYPGDGQTICLGNCRCSLQIDSTEDGGWEVTWIAESGACEDCAGMADDWNPLVVEPN